MIELVVEISILMAMIFIGLNLVMHHLLNKNGYEVGFFDVNFRLMSKFKTMLDEETDPDKKAQFEVIHRSSVICIWGVAVGIVASFFT